MCFDIPTEQELRNARKRMIIESSNEELYKFYYEVLDGISYYKNDQEMIKKQKFREDLGIIKQEFQNRNIKIPFDYTSRNVLNVHLGFVGIISLLAMKIIIWLGALDGFSDKSCILILAPFALVVLIGVINLFILSITNETPIALLLETLLYDIKNF